MENGLWSNQADQGGAPGVRQENGKPKQAPARLDRNSIVEACDASLKRLQTNYIDLYQVPPNSTPPDAGGCRRVYRHVS